MTINACNKKYTCFINRHMYEPCSSHEECTTKPQVELSPQTRNSIKEFQCENIPVIQKDLDAMSINFETPYASTHKRVQRKLSLPQIKILKKNSSQESDSPPDNASGSKKFFSGSSGSSSGFLSNLKKRKHALKRALSFQSSSTSSEEKATELESVDKTVDKDDPSTL